MPVSDLTNAKGERVNRIRQTRQHGAMTIERARDLAAYVWFSGRDDDDEYREAIRRTGFDRKLSLAVELRVDRWRAHRERRALGDLPMSVTGAAGGYLTAESFHDVFESAMLGVAPFLALADVVVTATGTDHPMAMVDDTDNSGSIVAVNTTRGEGSAVEVAQLVLKSYYMTSNKLLVPNELLEDSTQFALWVPQMLGERVGRMMATKFTTGGGSTEPAGILTSATVGKTCDSATAITADELADLLGSVDSAYRTELHRPAWMMNSNTLIALMKMREGAGAHLFPSLQSRNPELMGFPVVINPAMPDVAAGAKPVLFGAMRSYKIRIVGDVETDRVVGPISTRRDEGARIEYDQSMFESWVRGDGALADPASRAVKALQMAAA